MPIDGERLARDYLTIVAAAVGREVVETEAMTGRKPDPNNFEAATWFLRQVSDVLSARDLDEALELVGRTTRRALHWTAEGLPVGVQFAGAFGAEEELFSLAGQIERVQPRLPRLAGPTTSRFPVA